jgi:prephenate dehydratase
MRVAIQGEIGSFHHQAALLWFESNIDIVQEASFGNVFAALESKKADVAVIAIENSLYGSINEVHDLLEAHRFPIIGEIYLRIKHQLIALPGAIPSVIQQIYSHPVALAQCGQFLEKHYPHATRVEYHDTAASVSFIKEKDDPSIAAIASRVAAEDHSLPILAENIEDNSANFTRFLIVDPNGKPPYNANKASLILTTDHAPGALAHVLSLFAREDINLTKLQSRPIIGEAWRYHFYIDVETASKPLHTIIATIRQTGATVTVLGEYAKGVTR